MQYTCLKDGIIHFKRDRGIELRNWHFRVIDALGDDRAELCAYILIGGNELKAIINIQGDTERCT